MFLKSKFKLAVLLVIALSLLSLLVHLYLASSSSEDLVYHKLLLDDFIQIAQKRHIRKLWGPVGSLEDLRPNANPINNFLDSRKANNGFIYAKISGGFEKIQSSICDLVTISRLLNATLVIPEIQESAQTNGISSKFKSFSYLYNEKLFIEALENDITVVKNLPTNLKEDKKKNMIPIFKPEVFASPNFYINKVLPKLRKARVIELVIVDGGCLQSILPPDMDEYQKLRCRVAFHALHFRPEIQDLGKLMVKRLRASGRPYLVYHPSLVRETLAFNGCAELFQDVHTELIQYLRSQMIKRGIIKEELNVDSMLRRRNGSCPLMPEEVGLLLRAMGYPQNTIIYLAGSETFGGQRVLIPLSAIYTNLLDRISLCSEKELFKLIGKESPLPPNLPEIAPVKNEKELLDEWKNAGPKPRPLPPPPSRPFYEHEKQGWYGWVAEHVKEPEPSSMHLRVQAHQLLWDALDYYVSVEADAFISGFNNDGSKWPDFSNLVMGHRLYQRADRVTYRPDRKIIFELFDSIRDNMYYPKHNWTSLVREHLKKSLGIEGLIRQSLMSKPTSFLSHPLPECSCRISKSALTIISSEKSEVRCPDWMSNDIKPISLKSVGSRDNSDVEDEMDIEGPMESDEGSRIAASSSSELDEEKNQDD